MNSPTLPALLCALAATFWAPTAALAQEVPPEKVRTLDLSLPKEALTRAWGAPGRQEATSLPDLGGQPNRPAGAGGPGTGAVPAAIFPTAAATKPGTAKAGEAVVAEAAAEAVGTAWDGDAES